MKHFKIFLFFIVLFLMTTPVSAAEFMQEGPSTWNPSFSFYCYTLLGLYLLFMVFKVLYIRDLFGLRVPSGYTRVFSGVYMGVTTHWGRSSRWVVVYKADDHFIVQASLGGEKLVIPFDNVEMILPGDLYGNGLAIEYLDLDIMVKQKPFITVTGKYHVQVLVGDMWETIRTHRMGGDIQR